MSEPMSDETLKRIRVRWNGSHYRDTGGAWKDIEALLAEVDRLKALSSSPGVAPAYQEEPGRDYRKERDLAYTERNRLVAALARLIMAGGGRAWLGQHEDDPKWDPEWRTIVFIEGPTGQLSWHLHDTDVPLFDGLPSGANAWDGHSTPEKYERVAKLGQPTPEGSGPAIPEDEETVEAAAQGLCDYQREQNDMGPPVPVACVEGRDFFRAAGRAAIRAINKLRGTP